MQILGLNNKIALILASSAMITGAQSFGGVYAGADVGMGYSSSEHNYADLVGKGKKVQTAFGAVYGGHVGYLYEIGASKTIVGAEIYGNLSSMNPSFQFGADGFAVQGDVKIQRTNAIGLGLVIGKMFNIKTMVYGKMSYERATFKHEYKFRTTSSVLQYAGKTLRKNVSVMAPVMGLGLAYKPTRMIIVGGEYQFAGMYPKKKVINQANIVTEIAPVEHRLMLRVSFTFG